MSTITTHEAEQVSAANASGLTPVVLVHGLWLLAESWDGWRPRLEAAGYAPVAVDWPGDAATVDAARAGGDSLAGVGVPDVVDHVAEVIATLDRKPVLVGHSFGGLIVQILAGRGLGVATASIDPAPAKGVLPLPFSALKASFPVLGNPANRTRTVLLTFDQFRYGFANAVTEDEARELYDAHHVPAPGRPLFQAAFANLNLSTATKADRHHPERGPMLVITGGSDNIVPFALANAAYKRQRANKGAVTELVEIPGVGHSLVIDSHQGEVVDAVLDFLSTAL
ncbi:MAG: alpha/beta hydrolase [Nocardioides sp.]|uniref:alpha/beta hydrolase n=1 Tax=Nocardioides sp. TaxID=35761 RepID=UPI0039E52A60